MTVSICESIKSRRESLRLTQTELAARATEKFDKSEIKPNYINRLERGVIDEPSYPRIIAIQDALTEFESERLAEAGLSAGQK